MITDSETNLLYLADTLSKLHPDFFAQFSKILDKCNIEYAILPGTKDIWAVDYMPVQIAFDKFIQFVYNPGYLKSKKWLKSISDADGICQSIGINPIKSKIVIDGGNVVKGKNKVILCDKVFIENPFFTRKQLIKELQILFEVENLIFVPQHPNDFTGQLMGWFDFLITIPLLLMIWLMRRIILNVHFV